MQETPTNTYGAPLYEKKTLWYLSLLFLATITGLTILCYVMLYSTQNSIATMQTDISTTNQSISAISADRNIVIANIVQANNLRPSIDLTNMVTQFRLAAIRAGVQFDGFNIENDTISTVLTSTEGSSQHPDPVGLIINMMNAYSGGKEQFRLGTIKSISGDMTRRTTAIELRFTGDTTNQ